MEGGSCVTITLLVSLCLVGTIKCDPQEPQQQPQQQQPPEYRTDDSEKYSDSDYSDYSSNKQHTIECYTCHFEIRSGHTSGMEGCDKNNFAKAGIPSVTCAGPCAIIYQQLGEKQFMLTRNCVPSCKEHRSESGATECCYTPLCNAAVGQFRSASSCVVVAIFCTLLALLLRR